MPLPDPAKTRRRSGPVSRLVCAFVLLLSANLPAVAQSQVRIPLLWDSKRVIARPDPQQTRTIRFLTESDYPPFHFMGPDGQLTGFEIDLAREICERLGASCSVQPVRWDGLFDALLRGQGDAIIAALRIAAEPRQRVLFSIPYFRSPARFVARREGPVVDVSPTLLAGKRVAVVRQSAHGAYLRRFFPQARLEEVETAGAALEAVRSGNADAAFVDATLAVGWLNGEDCCRLAGGPYTEPRYFGEGSGIAVRPDAAGLKQGLDWALQALVSDGTYARLTLKYFPVGLY